MGADIRHLREGQIVWATLRDPHGFRKRRPSIILTPDEEISPDQPVVLMAVTTTYPDPAPAGYIELPWNTDRRRVATGLARRSAAVVEWLDTAYIDELDEIIGTVPPRLMAEIRRHIPK